MLRYLDQFKQWQGDPHPAGAQVSVSMLSVDNLSFEMESLQSGLMA